MLIGNINKRIFFNKYKVQKLIYRSSFCLVYEGINIKTKKSVAMKFERITGIFKTLETEAYNLVNLKGYGIPNIITFGKSGIFNILIEELLGASINNIWYYKKIKNQKVILKNICMLAIQGLDRIEYIHSKNIIHCDIKPDNFLIGKIDPKIIYLIDFGISQKFRSSRTGKHIKFQNRNKFFGSFRYMSLNANKGYQLSRRDDLESFGYMVIYLVNNNLPWVNLENLKLKKKILNEVLKMKSSICLKDLCKGLPEEFMKFLKYSRELKFEEEPDYNYLKGLFTSYLTRNDEQIDYLFFWINKNKKDNIEIKRDNFRTIGNGSRNRLYHKIKESLEKAKSQEQKVKFNFSLDKIKKMNTNTMSKDNKIRNYYINEKKIIKINNYNITKINNQFNKHKLTVENNINPNIRIIKVVKKSKNKIYDYNKKNNKNFATPHSKELNYKRIKDNNTMFKKYITNNVNNNLFKNFNLTNKNLSQNESIILKEKKSVPNINNFKLFQNINYKTF